MYIWVLFLASTAVYAKSRISEPGLKAVNFAKPIEGRKLNGSLIKEVEVDSEESCEFECVEEERCRSLNFGTRKNQAGRFKCQLCYSDRFFGLVNFTEDDGFKYSGIAVNKKQHHAYECEHFSNWALFFREKMNISIDSYPH